MAEAASRFGLPERWLRAVIRVESGGTARALSHAGAMGLMQLMPKTYAALRARLGLGADAFDPRNNVLAGAAYLRAMYDRFGPGGFLAAYNAGPERYAEHVARGRPLPAETRAYVARLASEITPASSSAPPRLQLDSLFTEFQPPVTKELVAPRAGGSTASKTLAPPPSTSRASALAPRASGLFAPVQQEIRP